MVRIINGPNILPSNRDKDGYRTYKATWLVGVDPASEGPASVSKCPGLPVPGTFWQIGGDYDAYAFCYWAFEISPHEVTNEPPPAYDVTFTFSTKPEDLNRCLEQDQTDPLLALPKISGSYSKYTEEATRDRFNLPITNSAFEQIRGAQNEWDKNRISVKIEQNVGTATQGYILPSWMKDSVNAFPLWGYPPRTIKLSSAPWEKKYWGACTPYYTRTLEFDIRYCLLDDGTYETWDRVVLDEGTKVLSGQWQIVGGQPVWVLGLPGGGQPNPQNPSHFIKATDLQSQPMKLVLNGAGLPASVITPSSQYYYVSITPDGPNMGNPLGNNANWCPLTGNFAQWTQPVGPGQLGQIPPTFTAGTYYAVGTIVTGSNDNFAYICTRANGGYAQIAQVPSISIPTVYWAPLVAASTSPLLSYKGVYNPATNYAPAQIVTSIGYSFTGNPGGIFIQKYAQADFTLLGIPLTF